MAKEFDLLSAHYDHIKVVPGAAGTAGEVLSFNSLTGELLSDISAAEVALAEERTLITSGNILQVVKVAGQVWVAGQPLYFDPAVSGVTNVKGILKCVGYVFEAALNAAVTGFMLLAGTPQAGNGMLMRSGLATFTGSSLSIDTGLTLIVEGFVTVFAAAQAAGALGYCTYDHGADGLLDLYGWDDAGVAAANAGTVAWMVLGS